LHILGGEVIAAQAGTASLQCIVGEEGDVGVDARLGGGVTGCLRAGRTADEGEAEGQDRNERLHGYLRLEGDG